MRSKSEKTKTVTDYHSSYSQQFAPEDGTIPYRLVGSKEYVESLESLSKLVNLSNEKELEVYDRIIMEQPEYAFYSGVVSTIGVPETKVPSEGLEREKFEKSFRKLSLAWMMALARVEIGATSAMYGDNQKPFDVVAPENFGRKEYASLLFDDLAAHLHGLETDPDFLKITKPRTGASSNTLAYLRRLKLVNDMLLTLVNAPDSSMASSAMEYQVAVKDYGKKLTWKVQDATYQTESSSSDDNTYTKDLGDEYKKGTVSARSTLTRRCQYAFLGQYGK